MALEFFDRIYAINLDRRHDRWASFVGEMRRVGVLSRVERVSAYDRVDPNLGCTLSHLKTLEIAHRASARRALILEDDARFFDGWEASVARATKDLPDNWDVFYLGYNLDPSEQSVRCPEFRTNNLLRLKSALTTSAYSVNTRSLIDFINAVRGGGGTPIDIIYSSMAGSHALYGAYPMAVYQADGYSDIQRSNVRYTPRENVDAVLRSNGRI